MQCETWTVFFLIVAGLVGYSALILVWFMFWEGVYRNDRKERKDNRK